jgi:hypothetical protein
MDGRVAQARMSSRIQGVPELRWIGASGLLLLSLLTANPLLTAAALLALALFALLLWRPGEPPILFLVVTFQWLQVTMRVADANARGLRVNEMEASIYRPLEPAIWLGLAALVVLAVGMRFGAGRASDVQTAHTAKVEAGRLQPSRLFIAYLVLAFVGLLLTRFGWRYLGLSQVLVAVASLKAVPLFLLTCVAFRRRTGAWYVVAAILLEVLLGLGGYFAGFKTVFFIAFLGIMAVAPRLTRRGILAGTAAGVTLTVLILFWTSIKASYRPFLNQGTGAQVVTVPWPDRLAFLARAARNTTPSDLVGSIEPLVERVAYVRFLADAVNYVPAVLPHSDGAIWGGAIRHILMPRILFPQKLILPSDSELTARYTGARLAGGDQGTSISMGYVAESYVDFGFHGMWLPILLIGLLWGWMYRLILRAGGHMLLRHGFAVALFLPSIAFETTAVKMLGGSVSSFLILYVSLSFGAGTMERWLEGG